MNTLNRRDLCIALSSFAALAAVAAEGQAQEPASLPETMAVPAPPGSKGDPVLSTPRAFKFEDLPVVKTANGETRAVTRGVLVGGEAVEMHETRLLAGHMPHPPHTHKHSEFILVREGQMQFLNNGTPEQVVGPGGVIFIVGDVLHGLKNVGDTTANYFVIAIGRDT
jgi:quercetin dioxygenase-like cupin family protein